MQLSLPLGFQPYNNRGLFAEHYLKSSERLQALNEWKHTIGVEEAFQKIAQLYNQRASRFKKRTNEAQTERDFIRHILDLLWGEECYQVQVTIPNVDASRQPDYAFFRTVKDRQDAESLKGMLNYFRNVSVLGDAKVWFDSLDKQRGVENPSAQICNYLYRSRVRWGILTNGRIWRLYEREKSSAGGIFYEVNLEDILQKGDPEAFKYFYLFFRRQSFLPDQNGVSFIEKVFQGSVDYATEVSDHLKESVYDALRHLMNGFIAHPANGLDSRDPNIVKRVHENCLIILYRLLFVLYAEDRDLLPCEDELYKNYSLRKLHKEINQNLRAHHPYIPNTTAIWSQLCNLFALIDDGFKDRNRVIIPAYNGGLFSPSKYPHIAHTITHDSGVRLWNIGDRYLAEAIDLLAYERNRWNEAGSRDVDYTTLDVQHLGSIYEGLLELQPHIAEESLVETLEDGKSVFKPSRDVPSPRPIHGQPPRTINAGEVYLVTNRGERKATGSYYTPKYIVDYIVENTIGPLAEEAEKKVAELHPEVVKEIKKLERKRQEWIKLKQKGPEESKISEHIEGLTSRIERQKRRLLEPYLLLKICDPAMGSGHFLVGAADFLSLAMATDPNLLPLDEMGTEDPQSFYKRLVVERCLYGVDLNPLAVELAKLSLWLHMVSKEKALSFLDHHLRCGNSLIGARVEDDLRKEPPIFNARGRQTNADSQQLMIGFTETLTATHLQHFLDTFREIMETPSGDAEMERKKDELYRAMDNVRDKFRAVANCWLAPYFGVPVTAAQYEKAIRTLRGTDAEWQAITQEIWFQNAQAVAHQKRFFHWELEFPEIFFDAQGSKPKEERGFDAVIGNPPWGAELSTEDKEFVRIYETDTSTPNSYIYFIRRGELLLIVSGSASFILPDSILVKDYAQTRRRLIHENSLHRVIYLERVFHDVNHDSTIIIFARDHLDDSILLGGIVRSGESSIEKRLYSIQMSDFDNAELEYRFNLNLNPRNTELYHRISSLQKIGDIGDFHEGIHTGNIRDKLFHRIKPSYSDESKIKPCLIGSTYGDEFGRYYYISNGNWTIYDSSLIKREQGEYASLRDENIFIGPKLYVTRTGDDFYCFYNEEHYASNNLFSFKFKRQDTSLSYMFIMAILNSTFAQRYNRLYIAPRFGELFTETKIIHLKLLPIPRVKFITPEDEQTQLT